MLEQIRPEGYVNSRKGLNSNQLKLIAVVTMLLDHIGHLLVGYGIFENPGYSRQVLQLWWYIYIALRCVGRIAFPIYACMLVEGFFNTRNKWRYGKRLALFAVLSEVPFDLMMPSTGSVVNWSMQSVMVTFLLGFLMMQAMEKIEIWFAGLQEKNPAGNMNWLSGMGCRMLLQMAVVLVFCLVSYLLGTDYMYIGIMLIAIFYWFHQEPLKRCAVGFLWMSVMMETWYFVPFLLLSFVLIYYYNGARGKWKGKYFFYLFYPVHMLVLAAIYYCFMATV